MSILPIPIVQSPEGFQYMLDFNCGTAYTPYGTPYRINSKHRSFEIIGYVTCLFAWQRGEMTPVQKDPTPLELYEEATALWRKVADIALGYTVGTTYGQREHAACLLGKLWRRYERRWRKAI